MRHGGAACALFLLIAFPAGARNRAIRHPANETFNFQDVLTGSNPLSITVQTSGDGATSLNGIDPRAPSAPFLFDWGDGASTIGFFPQSHRYSDLTRNYAVTVTSALGGSRQAVAYFVAPVIRPIPIPSHLQVTIPASLPSLSYNGRVYSPPSPLLPIPDGAFGVVPRATIEYVLSVAAVVETSFASGDVVLRSDGTFRQVVVTDTQANFGAGALWFTDPVAVDASVSLFSPAVDYSSLFHEIGHNVTLNMPASYCYGGKIDGPANAIYSEAMAQIFQHSTAYEIANNAAAYGIGDDLAVSIENSARASAGLVAQSYHSYITNGAHFASWNDPSTPTDETFDTFMTIAFIFMEHAEAMHSGYRGPLTRMTAALRAFNPTWMARYAQSVNSPVADSFRATLMVAALSYAFETDLRSEFRALNFPVDDATYQEVMNAVLP